ncbi:MAG: hypothetical protein R3B13_02690 [Polyangiaceae bacterium]
MSSRLTLVAAIAIASAWGCGSDDDGGTGSGGSAGTGGGASGAAGSGAAAGMGGSGASASGGTAGSSGASGNAGMSGMAGTSGASGASGAAGTGGAGTGGTGTGGTGTGGTGTGGVGTGGTGTGGTAAFWNGAYNPNGTPNPASGKHNAGKDCLNCHKSGGPASNLRWLFAGTVYKADKTTPAPHVQVGVRDGNSLYTAYSANNGNFWVPLGGNTVANWATVEIRVRNANGEKAMISAPNSGSCNTCHAGTQVIFEP